MRITYKRSLLDFDKVEIFEGSNAEGDSFLGLLVEEFNNKDIYCVIPISVDNLEDFENGEIELRSLFESRTKKEWYIAETDNIVDEPIDLIVPKVLNVPQNYLPKEGFYMRRNELPENKWKQEHSRRFFRFSKETKRDIRNILISFILGSIASILLTVFFSFENPIKDWFISICNPSYYRIRDVDFESIYRSNGEFNIRLAWNEVDKVDSYRIFKRQINFDDLKILDRSNIFTNYQYVGTTKECNIEDKNIKTGIYIYRIELIENTKMIGHKEVVWFHRFKVTVASNKINVRNFGDWCFKNKPNFVIENRNRTDVFFGYTLLGPIKTIALMKMITIKKSLHTNGGILPGIMDLLVGLCKMTEKDLCFSLKM